MGFDKRYTIDSRKVAYRVIGGEAVILNLDNGYYYSLNEVGTRVWEAIEDNRSVDAILDLLEKEYGMPKKQLRDDIIVLLQHLEKEELVEEASPGRRGQKK